MVSQISKLQMDIAVALEGSFIEVTKSSHTNEETGHVSEWLALYFNGVLLFTVSTAEQWESIYAAFEHLFSGPSSQEIAAMEEQYNK